MSYCHVTRCVFTPTKRLLKSLLQTLYSKVLEERRKISRNLIWEFLTQLCPRNGHVARFCVHVDSGFGCRTRTLKTRTGYHASFVEFVVNKVVLGHVSLKVLRFSFVIIPPAVLHNH
jgi:hypothetical protein